GGALPGMRGVDPAAICGQAGVGGYVPGHGTMQTVRPGRGARLAGRVRAAGAGVGGDSGAGAGGRGPDGPDSTVRVRRAMLSGRPEPETATVGMVEEAS